MPVQLTTRDGHRARRFSPVSSRKEAGQTLVEIAFLFPLFIVALVGAAELGRLAYAAVVVSNAARAGLQYGAQSRATAQDSTGMQQAALNDGVNVSGMTAVATHSCSCANGGTSTCSSGDCSGSRLIEYVQVNTSANVKMLFHCPGLPASLNVKAQAVMRVVQ